VSLRSVWQREALDFTPWLAENLSAPGSAIGLKLVSREAPVGDFSLDLLARDLSRDRPAIIENQLEQTDHDHRGKLLTYAAGHDASAVIWVAPEFREERRQALDWLNQQTDSYVDFFAAVSEVMQIDNSRPAFNFKLVASPHAWRKRAIAEATTSQRGEAYRAFFQSLIDELRQQHRFVRATLGQPQNWYVFSSGVSGVHYGANFALGDRTRSEVYIDRGDVNWNKVAFDRLRVSKADIETSLGERLEWDRMDDRQASRSSIYRQGSITNDAHTLADIRKWMLEHLLRFKQVFGLLLPSL
jgi:hypothetical protein